MVDLSTDYLGLVLKNPLVPSASPLTDNLYTVQLLQDAGAAAIVMPSLFEEYVDREARHLDRFLHQQEIGHAEADSFHPAPPEFDSYQERYLEKLHQLKRELDIPVIASLNGATANGWLELGQAMQQAGADALELNVYYIAADIEASGQQVEQRYLDLLTDLRQQVDLPIVMKLSSQFSAPLHFIRRLEQAGADGVCLFNRFYQPDVDLETLQIRPRIYPSTSTETLLRIRWTALLHGQVDLSLAVTGGFHTAEDTLKALLAGADIVQLCSVLLERGPQYIARILGDLQDWMESHEYDSIRQLKGSISRDHAINPAEYERANYLDVLDTYTPASGVLR